MRTIIKYNVFYKETRIGKLYINEEGQYKYTADQVAIKEVEDAENVCIYADARNSRDWGGPIAFFDSRIENCKRFGEVDTVKYPNSDYCFIKDNHDRDQ